MTRLSLRIDFDGERQLGPGKVRLLELIGEHGSISAAGRLMKMSYRRAWTLIAELNAIFSEPLITARTGGAGGGHARLTDRGHDVVARYRVIEAQAARAASADLRTLEASLAGEVAPPSARGD